MSYGIGIVILKDDLEKEKIRFDYCDWTLPIAVKLHPETCRANFKRWYTEMQGNTEYATMDRLMKCPCDVVCIIDAEGNFSTLPNRTPLNGIDHKAAYNDPRGYLTGKVNEGIS